MAVGDAHLFPGFLTPVLTQLSFQSHRLLFLRASVEMKGKNTPERKFASTGYRTHNYQNMSHTLSPQSHPGQDNVYSADSHNQKYFRIGNTGKHLKMDHLRVIDLYSSMRVILGLETL